MGALPREFQAKGRRAWPNFAKRLLLPTLCLTLGRSVVGGRESESDSVAVDTAAHFHKSGFEQRQEADSSSWRKASDGVLGEAGESAVIERLGREIAKDLAHELGQSKHAGKEAKPHHRSQLADRESHSERGLHMHSEATGLLEKLATISHDLDTKSADVSHSAARRHSRHTQPAAEAFMERLNHFSQALDTASALEKSADTEANIAMERSMDIAQETGAQKAWEEAEHLKSGHPPAASSALEESAEAANSVSLRDLAKIFQPVSQDIVRARALNHDNAGKNHQILKTKLPKHGHGGLDAVAGDLLQLKQAMVRKNGLHFEGAVPNFDTLDKDHKGSLSLDDFKALVSSDASGVEDIFKKVDKNGSGKIDKEEYDRAVADGIIKAELFVGGSGTSRSTSMLFVALLLVCKLV